MARQNTYDLDRVPQGGDKILITDVQDRSTKNLTIEELAAFFAGNSSASDTKLGFPYKYQGSDYIGQTLNNGEFSYTRNTGNGFANITNIVISRYSNSGFDFAPIRSVLTDNHIKLTNVAEASSTDYGIFEVTGIEDLQGGNAYNIQVVHTGDNSSAGVPPSDTMSITPLGSVTNVQRERLNIHTGTQTPEAAMQTGNSGDLYLQTVGQAPDETVTLYGPLQVNVTTGDGNYSAWGTGVVLTGNTGVGIDTIAGAPPVTGTNTVVTVTLTNGDEEMFTLPPGADGQSITGVSFVAGVNPGDDGTLTITSNIPGQESQNFTVRGGRQGDQGDRGFSISSLVQITSPTDTTPTTGGTPGQPTYYQILDNQTTPQQVGIITVQPGIQGDKGDQGVGIDIANYTPPATPGEGMPTNVSIPLTDPSGDTTPADVTFTVASGTQGRRGFQGPFFLEVYQAVPVSPGTPPADLPDNDAFVWDESAGELITGSGNANGWVLSESHTSSQALFVTRVTINPGVVRFQSDYNIQQSDWGGIFSAGTRGASGADGRTILNGSGAPADSLGNDGDFYIDTAATEIYGPKASGSWPTPGTDLIGDSGTDGESVAVYYSTAATGGTISQTYTNQEFIRLVSYTAGTTPTAPSSSDTFNRFVGDDGADGMSIATFYSTLATGGTISQTYTNQEFIRFVAHSAGVAPTTPSNTDVFSRFIGINGRDGSNGSNGMDGEAAGFGTPTTTTLSAGSNATVTTDASSPDTAKIFEFGIPEGRQGAQGPEGRFLVHIYRNDPSSTTFTALADSTYTYATRSFGSTIPTGWSQTYTAPTGGDVTFFAFGVVDPALEDSTNPDDTVSWTFPAELSGIAVPGNPGPTGPRGPMGLQGLRGRTGPDGSMGLQGDQGDQGLSRVELYNSSPSATRPTGVTINTANFAPTATSGWDSTFTSGDVVSFALINPALFPDSGPYTVPDNLWSTPFAATAQGPSGPAGPAGANGTNGRNGTPGRDATNPNAFTQISVTGNVQNNGDVHAEMQDDQLTLHAGSGIRIITTPGSDTISFEATTAVTPDNHGDINITNLSLENFDSSRPETTPQDVGVDVVWNSSNISGNVTVTITAPGATPPSMTATVANTGSFRTASRFTNVTFPETVTATVSGTDGAGVSQTDSLSHTFRAAGITQFTAELDGTDHVATGVPISVDLTVTASAAFTLGTPTPVAGLTLSTPTASTVRVVAAATLAPGAYTITVPVNYTQNGAARTINVSHTINVYQAYFYGTLPAGQPTAFVANTTLTESSVAFADGAQITYPSGADQRVGVLNLPSSVSIGEIDYGQFALSAPITNFAGTTGYTTYYFTISGRSAADVTIYIA